MLNVWSILLYSEYCHLTKWTSCPIFGLKPSNKFCKVKNRPFRKNRKRIATELIRDRT